jgi:Kef-type K+ transport system membrane component KefB
MHTFAVSPSNTPDWLTVLRHADVEHVLFAVIVQLVVILLAARAFAAGFRWLRQPAVVGEIVAGLILGPSVLGAVNESIFNFIFHPAIQGVPVEYFDLFDQVLRWIFTMLSQIGLVLLLFLIGLEFDFGHLRWHGKAALAIAIVGIALPFALGAGLAQVLLPYLEKEVPQTGFTLFMGTALSITAIPALGRMMLEMGIARTRLGTITITAAAVDDALGWILLASVAALVRASFHFSSALLMVAETLAFVLIMVFIARPVLTAWVRRALARGNGELGLNGLAIVLALVFGAALATNRIGIFAVFGAFLLGAVLSGEHEFREAVGRRLRDFVTVFFLPIYFTYTGLRTDVGTLGSWQLWLLCGLVTAAAIVGKFAGCGLAAWLSGFSPREAACIGAMMNTRALMGLIVINLGKDLGVIPDSVFCMLVLMAILTTVMTTPLLLALMRGTELEPHLIQSGFAKG